MKLELGPEFIDTSERKNIKHYWLMPPDKMEPLMAWARKALQERAKGKISVLIFPIYQVRVISFLEDHNVEIRYAGKIRWLAVEDGQPNPAESSSIQPCVLIIIKP